MKIAKQPPYLFNFTPQIFRYLEEIVEIGEKTFPEPDEEISIKNYVLGEELSALNEQNNQKFWFYLQDIGAIKPNYEKSIEGLKPGDTVAIQYIEKGGKRIACLPQRYFYIYKIAEIAQLLEERNAHAIISEKGLELIAKEIASHETGPELIIIMKKLGVPSNLIVYPNTKWRMLYAAFRVLNTSLNPKAQLILFRIMESFCHPFLYDGDESRAKEIETKLNMYLKHEDMQLSNGKLYRKEKNDFQAIDDWVSSDGEVYQPKTYLTLPNQVAKLYVLWNALINLTKLYLESKGTQDEELNILYFELIGSIEKLLETHQCGPLEDSYKRPFKTIIGCEFEYTEMDVILPTLYSFLGEITEKSLPLKSEIGDAKKEYSELLNSIDKYIQEHKPIDEGLQEILSGMFESPNQRKYSPSTPIPIQIVGDTKIVVKEQKSKAKIATKTKIKIGEVEFDNVRNQIKYKNNNAVLPPYMNEHLFCQGMFEYQPGEAVDWSIIYKRITGSEPTNIEKNKKMVSDTCRAVNDRIRIVLDIDNLFSWKTKTIVRNY